MNTWSKVDRTDIDAWRLEAMTAPLVVLEVEIDRKSGTTERRIYALFDSPGGAPPWPLPILREQLPAGTASAVWLSQLLVVAEWAEHKSWGEDEILREMWSYPRMSETERQAYRAKLERQRNEGRERAAKLLEQRKEGPPPKFKGGGPDASSGGKS